MTVAGFVRIIRPANAIVAGIAAIIAYLIATGVLIPESGLLFFIVLFVTGAGNTINDYFDAEIDAVNRPDRPIPSGAVQKSAARGFATTLFLAGVLISLFTNILCITIAVFNSLLLVAYAARLKRLPLIGNLAVSYLSASMFLFGGALNGWSGLVRVLPIAAITFFAMLSRELIKAAEDVEGDRQGGAGTLPVRIGVLSTVRLASISAVFAVIASIAPAIWWGEFYLAGIAVVDIVILAAVVKVITCTTPECVRKSRASTLLKAVFFVSLVVFTLSAVFL